MKSIQQRMSEDITAYENRKEAAEYFGRCARGRRVDRNGIAHTERYPYRIRAFKRACDEGDPGAGVYAECICPQLPHRKEEYHRLCGSGYFQPVLRPPDRGCRGKHFCRGVPFDHREHAREQGTRAAAFAVSYLRSRGRDPAGLNHGDLRRILRFSSGAVSGGSR